MTTALNRSPLSPGDDETAIAGVIEMFAMVQRSNNATAFAGWVVVTTAMGLVLEAGTLRSAAGSPLGLVLIAALVPVLALTARVLVLLLRANRTTVAAHEEFYRFIATTPPDAPEFRGPAWRQLQRLTTAARRRETLGCAALRWSYASGIVFLAWSAVAVTTATGH